MLGASGDYYFGAKLAAGLSLFSAFLVMLMPKDCDIKNDDEDKSGDRSKKSCNANKMVDIVTRSQVWPMLVIKTFSSVANSMIGMCVVYMTAFIHIIHDKQYKPHWMHKHMHASKQRDRLTYSLEGPVALQ